MSNPLLATQPLPAFSKVRPEHVEPALDQILTENRRAIAKLLENKTYSWDNFLQPLEDMDVKLNQMWSVVSHLMHVCDTEELRKTYQNCIPKLTAYATDLGQNENLFKAVTAIAQSAEYQKLKPAQQKIIEHMLRNFKLAGVHLPEAQKQRLREINEQLAQLTHKFEENVLDATGAWEMLVTDKQDLAGVTELGLNQAQELAKSKSKTGWLFNLEFPSYHAVITYAGNRKLREQIYTAYVTRASDQGPQAGKFDNSQVMIDILNLRLEEAKLLGFANYAELSLASNKMVKKTDEVTKFLNEIAVKAKPVAQKDWQQLSEFAKKQNGIETLQPWDVAYYSEKLRQHQYDVSQEELRPYFPEDKVVKGLFTIVEKLYGVKIQEKKDVDRWHNTVRYFELHDRNGKLQAGFYFDLYARPHKRGGAWMDGCKDRHTFADGQLQLPITYVTCNFSGPSADKPALFTHDEVITLLHEFGHALHHMLTKVDFAGASGTNGVDWDVVEFPSQFMENWGWSKESLQLLGQHYQTHAVLPDELYKRLQAAKNFQAGMQIVRQLEFGLFDFKLHLEHDPKKPAIQKILDQIRAQVTVVPVVPFNRFQHGFSHIFGGAYAAGYYSYKWAEVMSCDAFTKFEEHGIFDQKTGQEFLQNVLEVGGSRDSMEMFTAFRGREPKVDALLHHYGIEVA